MIHPDKVRIDPDRYDRDVGSIGDLVDSLKEFGQIEPIVVMGGDWTLVAGMRRLTAAKELGWTSLMAVFLKDVPVYIRKGIELEENLRRLDMSWDERDKAIAVLHELKIVEKGAAQKGKGKGGKGWRLEDTARLVGQGTNKGNVSRSIKIAEAIKIDPTLASEKSEAAAFKKIRHREIQEINKILAGRASQEVQECVLCGDSEELLKDIPTESIGLVLTDVPYCADVKEIYSKAKGRMIFEATEFDDNDPIEIMRVIKAVRDELYRVLAPGSHLYMFCGFDQIPEIREYYSKKFNVRHLPLIWDKVFQGYCPSKEYMWARNYECVLFMSKGTRAFNESSSVVIRPNMGDILKYKKVDGSKQQGINEKPTNLCKDFILLSSDEGMTVLDPFAGTGTTAVSAIQTDRKYIVIDKNPSAVEIIKARVGEEIHATTNE